MSPNLLFGRHSFPSPYTFNTLPITICLVITMFFPMQKKLNPFFMLVKTFEWRNYKMQHPFSIPILGRAFILIIFSYQGFTLHKMHSKIMSNASKQSAFFLDLSCLKLFDVNISHTFKDDYKKSSQQHKKSQTYLYGL